MAKPRITFTNLEGVARTLQSDYPDGVGCRLKSFHRDGGKPIGDMAHALADEALYRFRTSRRYSASFEMPGLRMGGFNASSFAASPHDIACELIAALLNGNGFTCALYTEDAYANSYPTLGLMPGTEPELALTDRRTMEYTLSLSLINLAASPVPIECHYLTGYEREVYLVDQGSSIYTLEYGAELADADAWLKDEGSDIYSIDGARAEKDRMFYLVDEDTSLVVV